MDLKVCNKLDALYKKLKISVYLDKIDVMWAKQTLEVLTTLN